MKVKITENSKLVEDKYSADGISNSDFGRNDAEDHTGGFSTFAYYFAVPAYFTEDGDEMHNMEDAEDAGVNIDLDDAEAYVDGSIDSDNLYGFEFEGDIREEDGQFCIDASFSITDDDNHYVTLPDNLLAKALAGTCSKLPEVVKGVKIGDTGLTFHVVHPMKALDGFDLEEI